MPDVNPYAAPQHDLSLNSAGNELGDGVWRDGDLLVMRKDAVLPERCIKCNGPASGRRLKVRLRWNERSAKIEVSLCSEHRRNWRIAAASRGLFCLLGIAATSMLVILTVARPVPLAQQPVWPIALMMFSLAGAAVIEVFSPSPVRPQKIDRPYVWLKQVDTRYLDQFPPLQAVEPGPGFGIWRDGELLVMTNIAVLPDRCVLCNAPAEGRRLKLILRWVAPLHLLGLSIPLIERRAKIEVGICLHHRQKRRRRIVAAWLFFFWSLGSVAVLGRIIDVRGGNWLAITFYAILGITLIAAAVSEWSFRAPPVKPHKIDGHYIWLKKVDADYLEQFPPFIA